MCLFVYLQLQCFLFQIFSFSQPYFSLTHTSINFYLSFTLYLPMYILDTITPSFTTTKKLVQYYLFSIFFNQGLGFTILRRHQLFLSDIFKVKSAIGWPLRWTKCTNRNDLFSPFLFGILTFSLCEVIFLFSFPNFLKILTFVTLNWLRPRLGERNEMERNEKNHFRIFSHSLV